MAERLIRESDILNKIDEWLDTVGYATIGKNLSYYAELKGCIADAPTIETKPVVHAHWIEQIIDGGQELMCSNCGEYALMNDEFYSEFSKYCPYCGAQMDEEINNG